MSFLLSNTASKEGVWEVDGTDLQPRSQLCDFIVTVMCVSDIYLTAGDEEGAISLFQSGPNGWSQSQRTRQPTDKSCCTCMLIIPEKAQMGKNAEYTFHKLDRFVGHSVFVSPSQFCWRVSVPVTSGSTRYRRWNACRKLRPTSAGSPAFCR